MKKALFFAGLAAASLLWVGCNKEVDFFGRDKAFQVILNNDATRTVNNGMHTVWAANDQLNAFYAPAGSTNWSSNIKFTVQDVASNLATGTVGELTESAYDWYFLYPYSSYVVSPTGLNAAGDPSGYMTVGSAANGSQRQTGYDSMAHLAGSALPVYGVVKNVPVSEQPVVAMHQIASVVKVNVKNATAAPIHIMNVAVTAPVDIVGTYYLDITGAAPAFTPSGETYVSKTANLTVQEHTDLAVGATATFYLAVKPFTAAAGTGLTVKVTGSNGEQSTTKTLVTDAVFAAGKIKEVNVNYDKAATVSEYEWVKKNLESITADDVFVIVGNNGADFAMSNDLGTQAPPAAVSVSVQDDKLMLEPAANIQWTLTKSGSNYIFAPKGAETHLYCTNTNNGVRVGTNENNAFTLDQGYLKNVATSRYVGIYNSSDWRCYTSINSNIKDQTFAYYVKYATGTGTPDKVFTAELEGALDGSNLDVPASAVSANIIIHADDDIAWTAEPSDGLSLSDLEGTGSATVVASFPANTSATQKAYSILVRTDAQGVANEEYELCITQLGVDNTAKIYPYQETFASGKGDFTIDDVILPEELSFVWTHDSSYGYMKASAYKNSTATDYAAESWLVSPLVDLQDATAPALTFTHATNYFASLEKVREEATVWVREEGGSWVALEGVNYPASLSWTFVDSGAIDLSAYKGKKVQIGFKFVSTATKSGTWEVKNFKLDEAVSGPVDPTFTVAPTLSVEVGKTAKINVTTDTNGLVSYSSANTAVATVAADGTVTGVAAGSTTITVAAAATSEFNAASAPVTVTVTEPDNSLHSIVIEDYAATAFTAGAYSVSTSKENGSTAPTYNEGGKDLRVYAKGTVTVSNSVENITKIVFNLSSQGLKRLAPITASTGTIATQQPNDTKVTWTGNASEVVFTVGDHADYGTDGGTKAGQLCFTSIDVAPWTEGVIPSKTLSSIAVSGQQTSFTVGDTFTVGSGVVTATYSDNSTKDVTEDAQFTGYDMSTAGSQTVTVSYTENSVTKTATYGITVSAGGGSSSVVDVLNQTFTGVTGSSYTEFSGKTGTSGAVYAGQCAGGNGSIQLRSSNNNSGIVTTASASGKKVTKVVVTWNSNTAAGRTLNIYGKNTAYSAATDLYQAADQGTLLGTIVNGTSTELTISGDYEYIGFRSASSAMYLDEVKITWE